MSMVKLADKLVGSGKKLCKKGERKDSGPEGSDLTARGYADNALKKAGRKRWRGGVRIQLEMLEGLNGTNTSRIRGKGGKDERRAP